MPPPNTLRILRAFFINSSLPNNRDPIGAPNPLDAAYDIIADIEEED